MAVDLLRATIWLALLGYAAAATCRLATPLPFWLLESGVFRAARWAWTLGCLAYLAHVATAFHLVHGWSHRAAMDHVREVGGIGEGILVNHAFTLCWVSDVLAWWRCPRWHRARPPWIDWLLHGFMVLVIFNATVVFAAGPSRGIGAVLLLWLGGWAVRYYFRDGGAIQ
jgi:hypothetical protein